MALILHFFLLHALQLSCAAFVEPDQACNIQNAYISQDQLLVQLKKPSLQSKPEISIEDPHENDQRDEIDFLDDVDGPLEVGDDDGEEEGDEVDELPVEGDVLEEEAREAADATDAAELAGVADQDGGDLALAQKATGGGVQRRRRASTTSCRRRSGISHLKRGKVCDQNINRIVDVYGSPDDHAVSRKRGIALANDQLTAATLTSLQNAVSWGYTWGYDVNDKKGPGLKAWNDAGIQWYSMVWSGKSLKGAEKTDDGSNRRVFLGFNEPNFPDQANMSPKEAADLWPRVEALAKKWNVKTLVGPAMNFNKIHPVTWFREFREQCKGCRIDAIGVHSYTCRGKYLKQHLDLYKKAFPDLPIWLTEFACADVAFKKWHDEKAQAQFMTEAIPMLEADPRVHGYSWFAHDTSWGKCALVDKKTGKMTRLGELYASFGSSTPVEFSARTQEISEISAKKNQKFANAGLPHCFGEEHR